MVVEGERAYLVERKAVDRTWINRRTFVKAAIIVRAIRAVLLFRRTIICGVRRMITCSDPHFVRRIVYEAYGRAELYGEGSR